MYQILSSSQFLVDGFSEPFKLEGVRSGGWGYEICSGQYSKYIAPKHFLPNHIEGSFVELNFRKRKWLLIAT